MKRLRWIGVVLGWMLVTFARAQTPLETDEQTLRNHNLPTDAKGSYSISHMTLGSYDLVVEMPDGVFVVEKSMGITEAKTYGLSLATVPSENVEKRVPSIDKPVKGYAWTMEAKSTKAAGFWKSPGGIAIIAGGAIALVALALSGGGGDDNNNNGSSSTP